MIKTCSYCDKFAYTTYRDQNWVEYKFCVDHIIKLKEKNNNIENNNIESMAL